MSTAPLAILGGSSLLTPYLLHRLGSRFGAVSVVSRGQPSLPPGVAGVSFAALQAGTWRLSPHATVVALLPITTLIPLLGHLAGAGIIVALSSTRRFSNTQSVDAGERAAAEALVEAEATLARWCGEESVRFTVLRPTLIYDMRGDMNLARMARFIRRFGILPVARPARGLRQPIHADDVASAIVASIGNEGAAGQLFNIAGGEQLTYRVMAERVFGSVNRRPRLLAIPTGLLRLALKMAERARLVGSASASLALFERMNEDLVFDVADGLRVLDYQPRGFDPT